MPKQTTNSAIKPVLRSDASRTRSASASSASSVSSVTNQKQKQKQSPLPPSDSRVPPFTPSTPTLTEMDGAGTHTDFVDNVYKGLVKCLADDHVIDFLVTKLSDKLSAKIIESLNEEIKTLKAENEMLKQTVDDVEKTYDILLDEAEQYNRRNNLRVFGVPESPTEDTDALVIEVFKKCNVDVTLNDIQRSHRVGKKSNATIDPNVTTVTDVSNPSSSSNKIRPRPIIVKFVSYRKRAEIFSNKKKLKGQKESISEDLTASLLSTMKELKEKYGVKNVWSLDGRLHFVDEKHKKNVFKR